MLRVSAAVVVGALPYPLRGRLDGRGRWREAKVILEGDVIYSLWSEVSLSTLSHAASEHECERPSIALRPSLRELWPVLASPL